MYVFISFYREPLLLTKDRKTAEFTLRQYLYRQRATLHGLDERVFKEVPKVYIKKNGIIQN